MVSNVSIIGMILALIVCLLGPVILAIVFLRKNRPNPGIAALFLGAATFIVFALILEQLLHTLVLYGIPGLGTVITGNTWLMATYGALAAGVFEETGRFLVMKFLLKKSREWKHGVAFGIGHGGIEAILLVGLTSINNLIYSLMINAGSFDIIINSSPEATRQPLLAAKELLISTEPLLFMLSGVERVFAVLFHIAMSVLVLYAVRSKKIQYFFLAVGLHFALDFPVAFAKDGTIPTWALEVFVGLFAVGSLIFIIRSKKLFEKLPPLVPITTAPIDTSENQI